MRSPHLNPDRSMMEAALRYAGLGLPVFPLHSVRDGRCTCGNPDCGSAGKHPRTPHGFKEASRSEEQVRRWWKKWPDANIGVPTGSTTLLLVVDVDPRNGGDKSLKELESKHGPFPETARQRTGGGGLHLFFRYPGGRVPKSLAQGIDLKGDGGYVVLAPSRHQTGSEYCWDSPDGAQALSRACDAPAWLLRCIRASQQQAEPEPEQAAPAVRHDERRGHVSFVWGPGERNNRLTSLAGAMRRLGASPEAIEAALSEQNRSCCAPPLPEGEVRSIARSIGRYTPAPAPKKALRVEDVPSIWTFEAQISWLISELLPEAAVTLLTGDSGVGKSTFALALAAAVANGQGFVGKETRKRKVVYLDRENPLAVVKERLHRMGIGPTENLTIWGGWLHQEAPAPTAATIVDFAQRHTPLIVFDSLVAFHPGSEQDATETRRFLHSFRRLANLGATVLVIHHTGKADTARTYRGSSDIKASVDLAYVLERVAEEPAQGLGRLRLCPFKNRLAQETTALVEWTGSGFSISSDPQALAQGRDRNVIEEILKQNPGINQSGLIELARERGVSCHRARAVLEIGIKEGWLAVSTGHHNRKLYSLVDQAYLVGQI